MGLLHKIKDKFQERKIFNEIISDYQNLDEVLVDKRIEIFGQEVTPRMAEIGLTNWNGKYIWSTDFNEEGIKHVVEYTVLKIYGGSFAYGNCFYSVPTITGGKKLINHRTDKSISIHYFKRLDGWQERIDKNLRNDLDRVSTINEKKFRASLDDILKRNPPKLKQWFETRQTIEQNIIALKEEIERPSFEPGQRIVSPEYILGFLYAQKADLVNAEYWINKHFRKRIDKRDNEIEMKLVMDRIKSMKN